MQIKPTVRYHFTLLRMSIIKKPANIKCWRGWGERWTLLQCWWECKLVHLLWRTVYSFPKKLKIEFPYDPAIPLLGTNPEQNMIQKDTCFLIVTGALFTKAKTWTQPKCPLTDEWIKKVWSIYTVEYYPAIKKKITTLAATWMALEMVILNKVTQTKTYAI